MHIFPTFEQIDENKPLNYNIFLNGIPSNLLPILEDSFPKIVGTDPCNIWILEKKPRSSDDITSLEERDAPFSDKNWAYHSDDSLWYISHCIKSYPSSVIRDSEGNPAV